MKKTIIVVSLLSAAMLTACGPQNPAPTEKKAAENGVNNAAVSALLPQGAFTVSGGFNNSQGPVTKIDGYVKYGTNPDGADCEADYTLTDVSADAATSSLPTKQRSVRVAGALSWYQDISNPAKPGEWLDNANPDASTMVLLFGPNLVSDDFGVGPVDAAGTGELCAIPMMSRIMSLENGELAYDTKRAEATVRARSDRWVERFIDAVGVTGLERQTAIDVLKEVSRPSFSTVMERTVIKVTKNADGSYEIVQTSPTGVVSVRLLFTPTSEQAVEPVVGKQYFDLITEEVKNSGLTPSEYLNKQS